MSDQPTPRAPEPHSQHVAGTHPGACDECYAYLCGAADQATAMRRDGWREPSPPEPVYDVSPGAFMEVEPSAPDDLQEQIKRRWFEDGYFDAENEGTLAAVDGLLDAVMDVLRREGLVKE